MTIKSRIADATGARWIVPNRVSRVAIIQRCIDFRRARTYLEIGVSNGECFSAIRAPNRIGVDPISPAPLVVAAIREPATAYFECTSDAFFAGPAPEVLRGGVDVAFIDGLHTFKQSYQDCLNVLRHLSPRGIILMHDCYPTTAAEAQAITSSYEEIDQNFPGFTGRWMGDTWKAIVALRSMHPDLRTNVLDADCGVGVIRRGKNNAHLTCSESQIRSMTVDDLHRDPRRLIGLVRPAFIHWALVA